MKTTERLIQAGLLTLAALMPFHAFLSVWLGHVLGHQALIQGWKEVLLAVLAVLTIWLIAHNPSRLSRLRQPWSLAAISFILIGAVTTLIAHPDPKLALLGLKTDAEFLIAGLIAVLVATPAHAKRLLTVAIAGGIVVSVFTFTQRFLLPPNFLAAFGYGPATIQPYLHVAGPDSALRFSGTLGGPNQLGAYLILISVLTLAAGIAARWRWLLAGLPLILIASYTTYSRSAWIGLAIALVLLGFLLLRGKRRFLFVASMAASAAIAAIIIIVLLPAHPRLQQSILHATTDTHTVAGSSDSLHALTITQALGQIATSPLGHGFGSAGPATFQTASPYIIENYYLQVAYETGWIGALAFIATIGLLIWRLITIPIPPFAQAMGAGLAGLAATALFWPAFSDSTTALVGFTLAAALTTTGANRVKAN